MKKCWLTLTLLISNVGWAADFSQLSPNPDTRKMLYDLAKWPQDCEQDYANQGIQSDDVLKRGGLEIYPLNKTQSVVQVLCFTAAYQANYYYVFVDQKKETAQLISFKQFDFDSHHKITSKLETNIAGLPTFKNGLLTLFSKARGIGDCGTLVTYGFTSQGKSYVVKAQAKECDDHGKAQPAENWPVVESKF